jgi:hypothetical protein
MSPLSAKVTVSWGNDVQVSLNLTPRNWAKLKAGKTLHIRGRGYYYEGEFFRDYCYFEGGLEGALIVYYGDDGATGFQGKLSDADIQEQFASKPKKNRKR